METIKSNVNCSYTIDLNGKKLSSVETERAFYKYGSGMLTICNTTGGGEIVSECNNETFLMEGGNLVISGGTIKSTSLSCDKGSLCIRSGDVEISGGVVTAKCVAIQNTSGGALKISAGEVSSTRSGGLSLFYTLTD